jgi:xanthine dehydrogenase accessory factor
MKEFFEILNDCNPNSETMTATIVSGGGTGEKAIFSDGKLVWASDKEGFLPAHEAELLKQKDTGLMEFNGTKIFMECVGHRKKMVICGAGHVAIPIIQLARMIGMYVTVLDDREEFTKRADEAGADKTLTGPFGENLKKIKGDKDTYFVIVTRGHSYDRQCLTEILKKPHAYIGMMGSKRRIAMGRQNMKDAGFDPQLIDSVHAPIGLNIGSETPEEISISILAEIIQVKNARKASTYPDDIMTAILGSDHEPPQSQRKVLATIADRQGSAPRQVGTKMLIFEDGSIINTIGGGLLEATAIKRGVEMLREEHPQPQFYHVGLKATDAAKVGEVCGGDLDIFLEEI